MTFKDFEEMGLAMAQQCRSSNTWQDALYSGYFMGCVSKFKSALEASPYEPDERLLLDLLKRINDPDDTREHYARMMFDALAAPSEDLPVLVTDEFLPVRIIAEHRLRHEL